MPIDRRTSARLVTRCAPLVALLGAGCAQQQAAEPAAEAPAVALAPQPAADPPPPAPAPQPQTEVRPPAPPPPAFVFPADLTGKALERAVAPAALPPLAVERFGAAPRPRTVPAKVLDPDAIGRAVHVPVTVPLPRPVAPAPPAPREGVPLALGAGADAPPARPVLPIAAVVTERARDVNLPPPAPVLGRPLADRVGLDDPTGELGNAEVAAGRVKTPLAPSGFIKVSVPDPFELAEHVRPRVPAAAEPSAAPVPVNPQRVK